MDTKSLAFAQAVRRLGATARELGLEVPGFRSPPREPGLRRTVRTNYERTGDPTSAVLSHTVAVTIKGRPWPSVCADMVDGTLVANDLPHGEPNPLRNHLLVATLDLDRRNHHAR